MADANNPFPRTVASITREGRGPQTHAYNDPNLSPKEFLLAVMRDPSQPMATRITAARDVAPYFIAAPRPVVQGPTITIVIGGIEDRDEINANSQSFSEDRSYNHRPFWTTPGPSYIEKTFPSPNTETPSNTLYSEPPSPTDIQQIAAVVHRLRPDLAHLPIPTPHLCGCGHWIFGPCPLGERCRDGSKLN
jgi:hypothetical protein